MGHPWSALTAGLAKSADKEIGVYRHDGLGVLGWARMPAVLLEAGSIINQEEELAIIAKVMDVVARYAERAG
jgi:N-acetylmuramoyl-L-alanine amidase